MRLMRRRNSASCRPSRIINTGRGVVCQPPNDDVPTQYRCSNPVSCLQPFVSRRWDCNVDWGALNIIAPLLVVLVDLGRLTGVELGRQLLAGLLAEGLFNKLAGLAAFTASEASGFHASLAAGGDDDLDGLAHAAPPT